MSCLIFSCYFGKCKRLYQAPCKGAYFFSNNREIESDINKKGWNFFFIDKFKFESNILKSSIHSKYIKFLMFLKDYPEFQRYEKFYYFDHKFAVDMKYINEFNLLCDKYENKSIIIRKTPALKKTIWHEVNHAKNQARYRKNMDKTVKFIESKIDTEKYSSDVRISNTGIILYRNYDKIKDMLEEIYYTILLHEQPECQIYWALFSQKYIKEIQQIDFKLLNPLWRRSGN